MTEADYLLTKTLASKAAYRTLDLITRNSAGHIVSQLLINIEDDGFEWMLRYTALHEDHSQYNWKYNQCSNDLRVKLAMLLVDTIPADIVADAIDEEIDGLLQLTSYLRRWAQLERT